MTNLSRKAITSFKVLGVRVHVVQIAEVVARMQEWIATKDRTHFVTFTNVHSVMESQRDPFLRQALHSADLSVPDGMPLVWLGRRKGFELRRRVYGPDLLWDFCRETEKKGYKHFFCGGAPGVPEQLAEALKKRFSQLTVVGTISPPFRPLTDEEDDQVVETINRARPDVLWVGLGCPKQERWMYENRERLRVPVMAGIGQAFDIYAGRTRQAPRWMREHGLEWLFRLVYDPRRLWRRYLVYNTQFVYCLLLERLQLKSFE